MSDFDEIPPATLNTEETKRFFEIAKETPRNILSSDSVENKRKRQRQYLDRVEKNTEEPSREEGQTVANNLYQMLKKNEILGQILRNQYGSLKRARIEEIIQVITNGSLRLVNLILGSEDEIKHIASYLKEKHPNYNEEKIRKTLTLISFLWTMTNIEKGVSAINVPEVREEINNVVGKEKTPAYDLIGYFNLLDSSNELTLEVKNKLESLLKKYHKDSFLKKVISIRTQRYISTHRSKSPVEQSICSLLSIRYRERPNPSRQQ